MNVIALTGAFTAFLGATIAITQNDIKGSGLLHDFSIGLYGDAMGVGAGAGLFPPNDPYFKRCYSSVPVR